MDNVSEVLPCICWVLFFLSSRQSNCRWIIACFSSNNDSLRRISTGDDFDVTKESEWNFPFDLSFLAVFSVNFVSLLSADHFDNVYRGNVELRCVSGHEMLSRSSSFTYSWLSARSKDSKIHIVLSLRILLLCRFFKQYVALTGYNANNKIRHECNRSNKSMNII